MSSTSTLKKLLAVIAIATSIAIGIPVHAQDDVAHAMKGIVKHVDHDTKQIVVKTADGSERTIKYTDRTVVHVGKDVSHVPADTWLGTKEGSKVVVRYTEVGGEKTAVAVKDAADKTGDALK